MPPYLPPANQGIPILYCDQAILVVDKPSGLLSVPGRGPDKQDCLLTRVQEQYPDALTVHRLDMETSGVSVIARNPEAHRTLSRFFQDRIVTKEYLAWVDGIPSENEGVIDFPLIADWPNRPRQKVDTEHGKPAKTRWKRIRSQEDRSLMRLHPVTGRSHQLRVHMQKLGHPILGDPLYATEKAKQKAGRLLLHASRLAFPHPMEGKEIDISCQPPFPVRFPS